jgi:hypothetical protein
MVFYFHVKPKLEEEELDEFFNYYRHRALLYVIKKISLETFKIIYEIRYIDITSKEDEREFKLLDILEENNILFFYLIYKRNNKLNYV